MSKLSRATLKVILFKSKDLKDGSHPVLLRVTYQRKRKYFSLKMAAKPTQWDEASSRYKRDREKNILIGHYEKNAEEIVVDFERQNLPFSFDRFEQEFLHNQSRETVFDFLAAHQADLMEAGKVGTAYVYKDCLNALKRFYKKDFSFNDIDYSFLLRWEKFLAQTNSINSISVSMRTLRAAYNKAVKIGAARKDLNPFDDYKIKQTPTPKRALKQEHIAAIWELDLPEGSRIWHTRNFFVFSYLTQGMNFTDMMHLQWKESILDDRITYRRAKTGKLFTIKIQGAIEVILNLYRLDWGNNSTYIFPLLTDGVEAKRIKDRIKTRLRRANMDLKELCERVGVPNHESVTFYVARHTYATVLKKQGVSTAVISEGLGHKTESITQVYLDSFENATMDKANEGLL